MKRVLAMALSLVLVLGLTLSGTIAYLTDTDSAVNVMTVGNVDIEQYETDAEGNAFEQKQPLYPAYYEGNDWQTAEVTGAIEKYVNAKNVGSAEAYVRTLIAFEAGQLSEADFNKYIHTVWATQPTWIKGAITVKGVNYYVACVDYGAVAAGAETADSLQKIIMDKTATNEIVLQFDGSYEALALTQAIQTDNFPNKETAWIEGFGGLTAENAAKWFGGIEQLPVHNVSTAAELAKAIEEGGSVILTDDIDMDDTMLTIAEGKAVYLDLNGHDLESDLSKYTSRHSALITVKKGASLTIEGEGNVHATAAMAPAHVSAIINNEAGDVTINGGTYTMTYGSKSSEYLIPTIVDNNTTNGNANLTINGGTFYHDRNMFRNFSNHKTEVATITINDGTFIADGDGAAYIWNQKPSATSPAGAGVVVINGGTFVGVKVNDEFGVWTDEDQPKSENVVYPVENNTTGSGNALFNAIKNAKDGDTIYLAVGTYYLQDGETSRWTDKSVTVIGAGIDETIIESQKYGVVIQGSNKDNPTTVTLKNMTISSGKSTTWACPIYAKDWSVTYLENLKLTNPNGNVAILLDSSNQVNGEHTNANTTVYAKNVIVDENDIVELNANPCTSYNTDVVSYAYFNYDADTVNITGVQPQTITHSNGSNLFVNGVALPAYENPGA